MKVVQERKEVQLYLLPRFNFLHAALTILASITFPENQSLPTPFPLYLCTYVYPAFFFDFLTLEGGTDGLS
jgi:hypothetical protein